MNGDRLIRVEGVAAALATANINTDIIAPPGRGNATHDLYGPVKDGAVRVFGPWRYGEDGRENPDFILNKAPFRDARFLVAGENFGCGSSRETAAMWLRAFGLRCIIAQSFGGIFFDNCFRNGILPLKVEQPTWERLSLEALAGHSFTLDMEEKMLLTPDGIQIDIALPAFRRALLMDGVDEIATIEAESVAIARYQHDRQQKHPWIWPGEDARPLG